ncbi:hypothetical protein EDD18DRAFT_1364267 [Armillaria luteobubalina]|uniref:Uncharacterized protein n=1 Tax=Armillaria luteobubalina TaxID=153913 RepID=A0AA39P858_9AGAR|nr:hypothetical protein EDD18DRAFT_1364267 [Armillaria luteobubalina]
MASSTDFSTYQSPSPTAKFSDLDLKFKSISELDCPFIAPQKSISGFTWSTEIPVAASAMLVLPNDIIPDLSDITTIIQQLPAVYEQGYHAIDISFCIVGTMMTRTFHFLKLHLCISINNHQEAISLTKSIVHLINTDQLLKSSHDYHMFMELKIFFFMQGFHSTHVQLWELGHLLDEKWIKEDILNLNFFFFDCVEPCNEDCEELAIGTIGGSPGITGYNEFNVHKSMAINGSALILAEMVTIWFDARLCCNQYKKHKPVHCLDIDPGDHHTGKTSQMKVQWQIETVDLEHNHGPLVTPGSALPLLPKKEDKEEVEKLVKANLTLAQIHSVLNNHVNVHPLEHC